MVRGIEFGDWKSQQWLTSILTGFVSSVILTQPLKIVVVTDLFVFFCRKRIDEIYFELDQNQGENVYPSLVTSLSIKQINRLEQNQILFAHQQRLKEIQIWFILSKFCSCLMLYSESA